MKKVPLLSLFVLLVLLLAACQPVTPPVDEAPATTEAVETPLPEATAAPLPEAIATSLPEMPIAASSERSLAGTSWLLSSLDGVLPAAGTTVTLQFGNDGTASGSDGCNRYTTQYVQDGQNLTFAQPMAGTMMACPEPAMTQAGQYQAALASVTRFTMSARQLVLFAGDEIVLTFIVESQMLAGSSWYVVSYNNGREAVVGLLAETEITLNFEEDRLNGIAGCNNYFAGYTASGASITVSPPGATLMFCEAPEGVMEQEAAYLAALESAATFSIEGDQLWLRTAADAIAIIAVKEVFVDLPEPEPQTPTGTVTGASVLNIRSGPSTAFPVVGAARQGDSGTIVGRNEAGTWWAVDAPSLPGGMGWVSADFVTATNAEDVPVIASPPTPVPTPTRIPPTATPVPPPTATPLPNATATPQAQISFWADRTQINQGECATLNWDVQNVSAVWVYPQGSNFSAFPRTGQGNERVCPNVTTTYEMRVQLRDGSVQFRQITINVAQPIASPAPPIVTPSPDPLAGTRWTIVNVNNGMGAVVGVIPGTQLSMDFNTTGQIQGMAGCNTYSAGYRAGGNSLTVDRPGTTRMFCESPEGVMEQEQQFLSALQSAATFQISGNQLHIRSGADALAIVGTRAP